MSSLPGYQKLEHSATIEATASQLVQLALDAIKSGSMKKVGGRRVKPRQAASRTRGASEDRLCFARGQCRQLPPHTDSALIASELVSAGQNRD